MGLGSPWTRSPGSSEAPRHAKRPEGPRHASAEPQPRLSANAIAWVVVGALLCACLVLGIGRALPATPTPEDGERASVHDALAARMVASACERELEVMGVGLDGARAAVELQGAVAAIEDEGYAVGYYVADLEGRPLEAYEADHEFYGASSVKGPFVLCATANGVPEGWRGLVEETIVWSDNDAYRTLRRIAGYDVMADATTELGIGNWTPFNSFVDMTPKQLASLWVRYADELLRDDADGAWLRDLFARSDNSILDAIEGVTAYSKPGWIAGERDATVDAGLVEYDGERYVLSCMTSKGEDFEALGRVVRALVASENARIRIARATGEGD